MAAGKQDGDQALNVLLFWLKEIGHPVLGSNQKLDPFERLISALEKCQAEAGILVEISAPQVASEKKIPDSVIYIVGDVLGHWYYSHSKLNTLFGGSGFPGDPPSGNCVEKCQEWLRRANTSVADPLVFLSSVLVEFMNLDLPSAPSWKEGVNRIKGILAKNSLAFDVNVIVQVAVPSVTAADSSQAVPVPSISPATTVQRKKTILFLAANPDDVTRLALDKECRAIRGKIRASDYRDTIDLRTEWAVRPDDLLQYLNEFRPHVVHFSGHGSKHEQLILHDERDQPKPVSKTALKNLFTTCKDNIRLVMLNACYSETQAEAIVDIIDCVVGMRSPIGDEAATTFAASFYSALGFGRSVEEAFGQGLVSMQLQGIPEDNAPVLLIRTGVDASKVFLAG